MAGTTIKDEARRLVEQLSEDATWEDLHYEIYFRQAVEAGSRTRARDEPCPMTKRAGDLDSTQNESPLDGIGVYRVLENQVDVVAVVHAAREMPRGL